MKINLNQTATVILTKTGADVLNKENKSYNELLKHFKDYYSKTDYVAGDEFTAQIWTLFETFGPHTHIGFESCFDGCIMDVKEWE